MAFKLVVSEGKSSHQMEVEAALSKKLIGLKIGEEFDASMVGLEGYQLRITGGSDKNGFPMKRDVDGPRRIRSLLTGGVGFRPTRKGQRRRKTVRGNTLSDDIVQVNTVVVKKGKKSLTELVEGSEE
ncbi:MAG: 30S ribosomal protein S6e [Methanobacteriaceae archaeon]|nr:30S ribosomal protein S6e [Methanobacteriaceae archaeon]